MVILGIDPGYGRLGYATLQKNKEKENLLDYSCIETSAKDPYGNRVLKIARNLEKLIKKHKPDVLALEKVFFTKNKKTALKTSEIRGIIIYLALKNKIKIFEYTPLQVKSAVCGYGKATKDQVKRMIDLILGLKTKTKLDDTSDAIALCLTHIAYNPDFD